MPLALRINFKFPKFRRNVKSKASFIADTVSSSLVGAESHSEALVQGCTRAPYSAPLGNGLGDWPYLRLLHQTLIRNRWRGWVIWTLQDTVEEIIWCVGSFEEHSRGCPEYEVLRCDFEALFEKAQRCCDKGLPSLATMRGAIEGLYWSIEQELTFGQTTSDRGQGAPSVEVEIDEVGVLECCRRIYDYFRRITFNISVWGVMDMNETNRLLEHLFPVLSARYDSIHTDQIKRGPCTEGTRLYALGQIHTWIDNADSGSVYWINGTAGTGKTTIAYTLCKELGARGRLAASFFCSRWLPECQDSGLIIPSVAYQLAQFSGPFRYVLSAVLKDPDFHLNNHSPDIQFSSLISQPLLKIKHTLPDQLVIVIDALDECANKEFTSRLLNVLLIGASNLPVKFVLSSRPEPQIRSFMAKQSNQRTSQVVLHEFDRQVVQKDIEIYLRKSLWTMDWRPTEIEFAALIEQSGISFIYAATAVRYIKCRALSMNNSARLARVLDSSSGSKFNEIDELYTIILRETLDNPVIDNIRRDSMLKVLHVAVCTREALAVDMFLKLLKIDDPDQVRSMLHPLRAVLRGSRERELVTTLHSSFVEYMLDPARSGQYYCNPKVTTSAMALYCFGIFRDVQPQFNICGLDSSYVPDNKVPGLGNRVKNVVSPNLFSAARYWSAYLCSAAVSPELLRELKEFLSLRLLLWMEIMNLKRCTSEIPPSIKLVKEWVASEPECPEDLRALVHDAWMFTTAFVFGTIRKSTPHIYTSMLPFWPKSNPISKTYATRTQRLTTPKGTAIAQRQSTLIATWHFDYPTKSPIFSPDGERIAIGSGNNVLLLNASNGRLILPPLEGHSDTVLLVRFSPDASHLASSSLDQTIRIWSILTGEMTFGSLEGQTCLANTIAFSPDGFSIVAGSADDTICVWDSHTGLRLLGPLAGHHGPISDVKYSPDGSRLIIISWDRVVVRSAADGQVLKMCSPNETNLKFRVVGVSPDGSRVACSPDRSGIYIWDVMTERLELGPLITNSDSSLKCISFSAGGSEVVSGFQDGEIYIWNVREGGSLLLGPLEAHTESITSTCFSPNNTYIVSGSNDRTLRLWITGRSQEIPHLQQLIGHIGPVTSVGFSPDSARIVSGSEDQTICVWSAESGGRMLGPLEKAVNDRVPITYSPDGSRIIANFPGGIVLLHAQTGKIILGPIQPCHSIQSAVFSSDGTRIITGTQHVVQVSTRTNLGLLEIRPPTTVRSDWLTSVACSPDGTYIAVGSIHSSVRVFNTRSGQFLYDPHEGHNNGSRSLAFSPDSKRIASGSFSTVLVQDVQSGDIVLRLTKHTDWIHSVEYSPDGKYITSGARDSAICVWDAETGQPILGPVKWHTAPIRSVRFSPDGMRVVSGSNDKTIRVTNIRKEFQCVCPPLAVVAFRQGH